MHQSWRTNPHKQAALVYGGLGVVVIVITFAAGLAPASRASAAVELGIGSAFILLFAGLLFWRNWWLISAALVFSNMWRFVTYFNDARGLRMELIPFRVTPITAQPVAFVNALLMAVIVVFLARSAWLGVRAWQAKRRN